MNRSQAIASAAKRCRLTQEQVETAVSNFLEVCTEALVQGEKVAIRRFGNFEPRLRRAMTKPNPKTGEMMEIPQRMSVAFLPSDTLKDRINEADEAA